MSAAQDRTIRALRDCGALGVREPGRNTALEQVVAAGLATVRTKRIGGAWWRVYSLVRAA